MSEVSVASAAAISAIPTPRTTLRLFAGDALKLAASFADKRSRGLIDQDDRLVFDRVAIFLRPPADGFTLQNDKHGIATAKAAAEQLLASRAVGDVCFGYVGFPPQDWSQVFPRKWAQDFVANVSRICIDLDLNEECDLWIDLEGYNGATVVGPTFSSRDESLGLLRYWQSIGESLRGQHAKGAITMMPIGSDHYGYGYFGLATGLCGASPSIGLCDQLTLYFSEYFLRDQELTPENSEAWLAYHGCATVPQRRFSQVRLAREAFRHPLQSVRWIGGVRCPLFRKERRHLLARWRLFLAATDASKQDDYEVWVGCFNTERTDLIYSVERYLA